MKEIPTHTPQPNRANRLPLFAGITLIMAAGLGWLIFSSHRPKTTSSEDAPVAAAPAPAETSNVVTETPRVTAKTEPGETSAASTVKPAEPIAAASLDELIKILRDPAEPMKARIKAARALLADGSDAAMAAIKQTLHDGPAPLRAAIAEGLGSCPNPESYALMVGLVSDADQSVAMAAVRGLAHQGSAQAANVLNQTLYNESIPLDVRCEAAAGLGEVNQPGTVDLLTHAMANITDEAIATQLLNALGNQPFDQTKGFYENYLKSPSVSSDLKVTALESLANAQGDPTSLLLGYSSNPDAELRASAAWTLSTTDTPGKAQDQIMSWLQSESDPSVRLRLYQALGNQENFNVPQVEQLIQNEADPSARTAGYDLIAKMLGENPSPDLATYFDANAVPSLKNAALTATTPSDRMSAVIALKRAGTSGAASALQDVAAQSTDPRVRKSAGGG